MLIKKKLLQIPPQPCPDVEIQPTRFGSEVERLVAVQAAEGIVVADIYDSEKRLIRRFFADGSNWQNYDVESGTWNQRQNASGPGWGFGPDETYITESQEIPEEVQEIIGRKPYSNESLDNYLWKYTYYINSAKRDNYERRKGDRIYKMLKDSKLPAPEMKRFHEWLLKEALPAVSMMSPKNKKKKNPIRCLSCGCRRQVTGIRHKGTWICPKCGRETIVYEERYITARKDKESIAYFTAVPGGFALVAGDLKRGFSEEGKQLIDYRRRQICYRGAKEKKDLYDPLTSWNGFKFAKFSLDGNYILYPGNLEEALESEPALQKDAMRLAGKKASVFALTDSLNMELIRRITKAGLLGLLEGARSEWKLAGSFEELTGIDQNYIHEFRVNGYGWSMIATIKAFKEVFEDKGTYSPKQLEAMSTFGGGDISRRLRSLYNLMTSTKCINYFAKQIELNEVGFTTAADWYIDYIDAVRYMNRAQIDDIDLDQSYFRFPKNIKEAHDRLEAQITGIKEKRKSADIKERAEEYKKIPQPAGPLKAIIPESVEEFMNEGAALHHCVGWNPVYRSGQADGSMLTYFIRKKKEPEKPFFTATYTIRNGVASFRESYGQQHKLPTKEVMAFIDAFMDKVNAFYQEGAHA